MAVWAALMAEGFEARVGLVGFAGVNSGWNWLAQGRRDGL